MNTILAHVRRRAAAVALGLIAPAAAIAAPCKLTALEMPVTMLGLRAVATVGINGADVPMTVDSGAFYSFLTEAAAQQLSLKTEAGLYGMQVYGITGKVDARVTTVKQLQLAKGNIPNVEFIVGGNEPGQGTMGLLGRNLLTFTDVEFDFAHGMVRLMFPEGDCNGAMAYWADEQAVSALDMRRDHASKLPELKATVQINGKNFTAVFDTGAPTTLITRAAARRAGVAEADMRPDGTVSGMGSGEEKAWTASFQTLSLGGETIRNNRLRVGDFSIDDVDMLIGADFFLSHRVYLSKSQRRMYFTYNGGAVFALNVSDSAARADEADADQPADAAGYARRGAARAARGDYELALADLDRACAMAPEVGAFFTRRAQARMALEQFPQALEDFTTALRLDPAQWEARLQRARLRLAAGEADGALDDLQALDKSVAPQANVRQDLAEIYGLLEQHGPALAQWNLWIASHPKQANLHKALNGRCWARAMLGIELDKALEDCEEAVDRQPENGAYLDSRAWVHLRRGKLRDALRDFDSALKLMPDSAWSLYGRGLTLTKMGHAEQGLADITLARRRTPGIDEELRRYGLALSAGATGAQ